MTSQLILYIVTKRYFMNEGIITIDNVFPEHRQVTLKLSRLSELLSEINDIQIYLNKLGFNIDVHISQKELTKVN